MSGRGEGRGDVPDTQAEESSTYNEIKRKQTKEISKVVTKDPTNKMKISKVEPSANTPSRAKLDIPAKTTFKAKVDTITKTPTKAKMDTIAKTPSKAKVETQVKSPRTQMNTVAKTPSTAKVDASTKPRFSFKVDTKAKTPFKVKVDTIARTPSKDKVETQANTPRTQMNTAAKIPFSVKVDASTKPRFSFKVDTKAKTPFRAKVNTIAKTPSKAKVETPANRPSRSQMNTLAKTPSSVKVNASTKSLFRVKWNIPAKTPDRAIMEKDKKKANMEGEGIINGIKTAYKSSENTSTKIMSSNKKEMISQSSLDVQKMEFLGKLGLKEVKKATTKLTSYDEDRLHRELHEMMKEVTITIPKVLPQRDSKIVFEDRKLSFLEFDGKVTEARNETDYRVPSSQNSKDINERKLNLDLKVSNMQQCSSVEDKKSLNLILKASNAQQCTPPAKEKQTLNVDLETSNIQPCFSPEDQRKKGGRNTTQNKLTLTLPHSTDVDERKLNLDLKVSKVQQSFPAEDKQSLNLDLKTSNVQQCTPPVEEKQTLNVDLRVSNVQQCSLAEDKQSLNLDLKASNAQQCTPAEEKQTQNVDLETSNIQPCFPPEDKRKKGGTNTIQNKPTVSLHHSTEVDKRKLNLDLKVSKVQQGSSPEDGRKISRTNITKNKPTRILQHSKDIDERKFLSDITICNQQWEDSVMRIKNNVTKTESDVDESKPKLQYAKDTDEQKCSMDMIGSEFHLDFTSDYKNKVTESSKKEKRSSPMIQNSKDIDQQKIRSVMKASKMKQDVSLENMKETESKTVGEECNSLLETSKLMHIEERIQNSDLSASNTPPVFSFENQNKVDDKKSEEREGMIHLRRDVNMQFEFDNTGNKKVKVDDEDQYTIAEKQKVTFDIGNGNVKLSFTGNKICLYIQNGEIDCSVRKNQVVFSSTDSLAPSNSVRTNQVDFSLTDSTTPSDSLTKSQRNSEMFIRKDNASVENLFIDSEDTISVKNLDTTDTAVATSNISQSETKYPETSRNVHELSLKEDSPLVPKTSVQRNIENASENFLASLLESCRIFESSFNYSFKQGNKDSSKE